MAGMKGRFGTRVPSDLNLGAPDEQYFQRRQEENMAPAREAEAAAANEATAAVMAENQAMTAAQSRPPVQRELSPRPAPAGQDARPALASAYRRFLPSTTLAPAPAAALAAPSLDLSPVTAMLQQLTARSTADADRQGLERKAMRDLLMGRIDTASKPVDANDPGIKGILAAQRLSRQRSEERQRSQAAVKASSEGLLDSGAFDTELAGIQQGRGEGEAADIAEVMGQEHQAKRQELLQLYQQAIAQGDAESARTIQQQLATLGAGVQTAQIGEGARQFDLGRGDRTRQQEEENQFRRSSFLDNLRLQMAQLGAR